MNDQIVILVGFAIYFTIMMGIGYYFYKKSKNMSDYLLGGRTLGPYVSALSAQASDMSGWLLLGLPGSIYAGGLGGVWVGIGLAIGSYLAWLIVAKRIRVYSKKAGDSITLSEFFSNRFKDTKGLLRTVSAIIILVVFTVYVASGFVAGGNVFMAIFDGVDYTAAMLIGAAVIVVYTFLGGFKAVCWTDFLQGMLMLVAIVIVPLAAIGELGGWDNVSGILNDVGKDFLNIFYLNGEPLAGIAIISSLAWGLGYFGMPHIIVRYMAIEKPNDIKVARRISLLWITIALTFACLMGLVARAYNGDIANPETAFIVLVGAMFAPIIMGILYSALMAAIMSTADSQLLVVSSAVVNDIYSKYTSKDLSENQLMWISRGIVVVVAVIAALLALDSNGSIMSLVSYAWAGFGAAFGPIVLLSLFWRRFNNKGAVAGMIVGFVTIVLWNTFLVSGGIIGSGSLCLYNTGIYELLPGFIFAMITAIVVSLLTEEPSQEVYDEFDAVEAELEQLKAE